MCCRTHILVDSDLGSGLMKVTIKQWVPVTIWKWPDLDENEDVCGICRAPFEATCPSCAVPGFDCPPITGQCSHSFHHHCILKWLNMEKTRQSCPMCRQPFVSHNLREEDLNAYNSTGFLTDESILNEDSLDVEFEQ